MKRYLASSRTRSNTNRLSAIEERLIREFTAQAQSVMEELSGQFAQTLQTQATQALQDQLLPNLANGARSGSGSGGNLDSIGGIGQFFGTAVRYLVSRPKTSHSTAETSRSIDARLNISSAQAAAEAQLALNKGSKNL